MSVEPIEHLRQGVQHVGRDDHVATRGRITLRTRRLLEVEQPKPHRWITRPKPLLPVAPEGRCNIGEDILHVGPLPREPGRNRLGGRPGAGADLEHPRHSGEIYSVRFNPGHRWFFASNMQPGEVLLLKNWDSAAGVASYTPHTGFRHPGCPSDAVPRESIEARTLVIFP